MNGLSSGEYWESSCEKDDLWIHESIYKGAE